MGWFIVGIISGMFVDGIDLVELKIDGWEIILFGVVEMVLYWVEIC